MPYTELDYLKDEVANYRQAENDRLEEERRKREQRRQEMKEQIYEAEHSAENWPEALQKQIVLFNREAAQWEADDEPDEFFGPGALACARALEIWREIEQQKRPIIEELEAQIAILIDGIRYETARQLNKESTSVAYRLVSQALLEQTPSSFLYW